MNLYEKLTSYGAGDAYPMHMPGHKRNRERFSMENPYGWDITEIDGFDDLHEPEGILREAMEEAAQLWGAEDSYFLINGSTAGILSGIAACTGFGDRILMARNCHKSVYHAVVLNQLDPEYLYPEVDPATGICAGIDPICVEQELKRGEEEGRPFRLVVLTSPTYEGILSDVQMIADLCHRRNIPLLVDEAHGAHLSTGRMYTSCFPESALACGADVVVQSLHKTLPAFTQTGIVHRRGGLVKAEDLQHWLHVYQTSSPSYVLMAGIDRCVRWMREEGRELLGQWAERQQYAYRELADLKCLSLLTLDSCERFFAWDPSKFVVLTGDSGRSGPELMSLLREKYHLEAEMASRSYIIAMTGAGDTREGIERFVRAIREIDAQWAQERKAGPLLLPTAADGRCPSEKYCAPWRLRGCGTISVDLGSEAEGEIAAEFVYAYPPGIPILVPGERITDRVLAVIRSYEEAGISMSGYADRENHRIRVLHDSNRPAGGGERGE